MSLTLGRTWFYERPGTMHASDDDTYLHREGFTTLGKWVVHDAFGLISQA